MATCKDCFHYEACLAFSKIINAARDVESGCEHFINRTEVVKVPVITVGQLRKITDSLDRIIIYEGCDQWPDAFNKKLADGFNKNICQQFDDFTVIGVKPISTGNLTSALKIYIDRNR